jgi:hypothetical protein
MDASLRNHFLNELDAQYGKIPNRFQSYCCKMDNQILPNIIHGTDGITE